MPFQINVLDGPLAPERRAVLTTVLVAHGAEPELADLVSTMMPGKVAEVGSAAESDRLVSALTRTGFEARVSGAAAPVFAPPAPAIVSSPLTAEAPHAGAGIRRAAIALFGVGLIGLALVVAMRFKTPEAPENTAPRETAPPRVSQEASSLMSAENTGGFQYTQAWVTSSQPGYVNVRAWGSINATVTGQLDNGQVVYTDRCDYVASENKTWCRTNATGELGWISKLNLVEVEPPGGSF